MTDQPFIFERYAFEPGTGALRLHYRYENGPTFEEKIVFPPPNRKLSANDLAALDSLCRLLFLLAGVSYYKAYVPTRLICEAFPLDPATADFAKKVYRNGLGEFSYVNRLDLSERIRFMPDMAAHAPEPVPLTLPDGLCLPVGGGKDSIVSLELLKKAGEKVTLFALATTADIAEPIRATIETSGLPYIKVERTLSAKLFELNQAGAYNGHVPITAILSVIALMAAVLQGCKTVVMSNEHSASMPNVIYNKLEINHQYSKSFEFEQDLAAYLAACVSPDLGYFSLLRPLSEIEIARRFAQHTQYRGVFRSCNTAFKLDAEHRNKNWCGDCPKCRFVFLALAPFIDRAKLTGIFGKNMLDDPAQKQGYAELCGLTAHKPFECVGEIEESALVLEKLHGTTIWKDDFIVRELGGQLHTKAFARAYAALFEKYAKHRVPDRFMRLLDARG